MTDAGGAWSDKISLLLEEVSENACRVRVTPDEAWLSDPSRLYPVTLDPVMVTSRDVSDIHDTYADTICYEGEYQYLNPQFFCTGNNRIRRSFLKFALPEISSGDMVIAANLFLYSTQVTSGTQTLKAHRVLEDWNVQTMGWNTKPLFEEEALDYTSFTGNNGGHAVSLDITRAVKDWYNTGNNYGIMLRGEYEVTQDSSYFSSDNHDDNAEFRPCIAITYASYTGLEDRCPYHVQDAGRAGTAYVNDYCGNLVLVHNTFSTGGSLMPMALKHVYNTNDRRTDLGYGYGWRLNYHQTLQAVTIGETTYYQHVDSDGTSHYFYFDTGSNTSYQRRFLLGYGSA